MILRIIESIICSLFVGFLKAFIPQYMVKGKENIPIHVMKVPKGIVLSLSKANVNNEDPVTNKAITVSVNSKEIIK
jgi:hypothetical protein